MLFSEQKEIRHALHECRIQVGVGVGANELAYLKELMDRYDEVVPAIMKAYADYTYEASAQIDDALNEANRRLGLLLFGREVPRERLIHLGTCELRWAFVAHIEHASRVRTEPPSAYDDMILIESIRRNGLRNPIICYQNPGTRLLLLDGERRVNCLRTLGYERVPAWVYPTNPGSLLNESQRTH